MRRLERRLERVQNIPPHDVEIVENVSLRVQI
jgi:hypothetical protein